VSHPSQGPWGDWDDEDDDWDDLEGDDAELPAGPVAKPRELLALHDVTAELFTLLRSWFDIGPSVELDLREVDSAVAELGDPQMVVALAMRKLQALHLLATPGVRTTTDVVVAIVNDLERAMVQAPNMWLKRRAAATDWDDALATLTEDPGAAGSDGAEPAAAERDDAALDRYRYLHSQLHDALFAVIEVSDGAIRELE